MPELTGQRLYHPISNLRNESGFNPLIKNVATELIKRKIEMSAEGFHVDAPEFHFGRNCAKRVPIGRRSGCKGNRFDAFLDLFFPLIEFSFHHEAVAVNFSSGSTTEGQAVGCTFAEAVVEIAFAKGTPPVVI